ncbi:cell division cycle protein 23 homolog [Galendromus occidentalis]|uniref:Cell division cycle protein 23 homolog n=1 Tax=Galendromus occidentalis TaxID=34638 RepID=A0AAJ6QPL8_9ACAR|nr:cell division cycle protein 23 homolog [Galendromus occidentalis]
MESEISSLLEKNFDAVQIKSEILESYRACQARGLLQSTKFFAELLVCLKDVEVPDDDSFFAEETDKRYLRCFAYFNRREYNRAEYFAKKEKSPKSKFLYYYSKYQSCETKRADNFGESIGALVDSRAKDDSLKTLYWEMKNDPDVTKDGYCLYLFGVVQRIMGLHTLAMVTLQSALKHEPFLWAAWTELSLLPRSRAEVISLRLPYNWITLMFLGKTLTAVDPSLPAVQQIWSKLETIFPDCPYITTQRAVSLNARYPPGADEAQELFMKVREADPCRLDNLDTLSNILFVGEQQEELAKLAQEMQAVDPHRSETCGVVGNVFSFRRQHAQALLYFKKAIKINVNYFPAWTFMGHEYAAIKNYHAAVHSYAQAIEVNKRDHRAWASLSLMYEQLKMSSHALYYQERAQRLRPTCPQMMFSLAERYEKSAKNDFAALCYSQAHELAKGNDFKQASCALYRLARLYLSIRENEKARFAYENYVKFAWDSRDRTSSPLMTALIFLCEYYLTRDADEAQSYLKMLDEIPEGQEAARRMRDRLRGGSPQAGVSDDTVDMTDASDSMVLDTSL